MRFLLTLSILLALVFFGFGCTKEDDDGDTTPPVVTLTSPVGGEVWGGTKDITWTTVETSPSGVSIEISGDSGANWTLLAGGVPDSGSTVWDTATEPDGIAYRIRIHAVDTTGNVSDWSESAGDFTVDNTDPSIHLTSPMGGEIWGGTRDITWTTTDINPSTATIEVSDDSGALWTAIASSEPDAGSYAWDTSVHSDGTGYRVRVMATDATGRTSTWSASTSDFELDNTPPLVALTSPVGGENWAGTQNITWITTDGNVSTATLELSSNSGGTWNPLVTGIADTGSCAWDTSVHPDGSTYRVRVRVRDAAGNDSAWIWSMADFMVDNLTPVITLTSPLGGEVWTGTNRITWTNTDTNPGSVHIEVSQDSGGSWNTLAAAAPDTGIYWWDTTTTPAGSQYRIRLTATDAANRVSNPSASNSDFTVLRYFWTRRMGGAGIDSGSDIVPDSAGNVYVTGSFNGLVDFQMDFGGTDLKNSAGGYDIFVAKINTDGSYGWTRRMGGTGVDQGRGIAMDVSGNVFVTGRFSSSVNFSSDFGGTDSKTSAGSDDIFVTKINADGTYGWTRRMGGTSLDEAYDTATDGAGNIFVTGRFGSTVDFAADFGSTDIKTAQSADVFVTRINSDGSYGWTRRMGGTGGAFAFGIATDVSGNVFVTGDFYSTVDFRADFGGTDSKTSAGQNDIFVTKINADGTYAWTRRMGGTSLDYGYDITTDVSGNILMTGGFMSTVNFRADFGGTDIKTAQSMDIFVTRINPDGSYGWTRMMGGPDTGGGDYGYGISTDSSGDAYVTGFFEWNVDFRADFGGTDLRTSAGNRDIFVTKINADGSYGWTRTMGGSNDDAGQDLVSDGAGNIYVTGSFQINTVNFGADFGVTDLKTPAGSHDIFVTKFK
jgi:hypothetical protein